MVNCYTRPFSLLHFMAFDFFTLENASTHLDTAEMCLLLQIVF